MRKILEKILQRLWGNTLREPRCSTCGIPRRLQHSGQGWMSLEVRGESYQYCERCTPRHGASNLPTHQSTSPGGHGHDPKNPTAV